MSCSTTLDSSSNSDLSLLPSLFAARVEWGEYEAVLGRKREEAHQVKRETCAKMLRVLAKSNSTQWKQTNKRNEINDPTPQRLPKETTLWREDLSSETRLS